MINKIKESFKRFMGRYYAPSSITNVFIMLLFSLALNLAIFLLPLLFKPNSLKFYFLTSTGFVAFLMTYASPILLAFFAVGLYKGSSISFYAIVFISIVNLFLFLSSGFGGGIGLFTLLFYGLILYSLWQPESRRYCNIKIGS